MRAVFAIAMLVAMTAASPAQEPMPPVAPAFEVVVLKRNTSGDRGMARLSQSVSGLAGRFVVDRTGLAGDYEFTLEYSAARPGEPAGDDKPNIFTALQEQLGLKLEPTRSLVEIVVIDHIERPAVD